MSKINPFLKIRGDLETAYSSAEDDFKCWFWIDKRPPKEELLDLLEEYYSRVLSEESQHRVRPSTVSKRAKSILVGARKITTNLRGPMGESQLFIKAWIQANNYSSAEEDTAFWQYANDVFSMEESLQKLTKACEFVLAQDASDIRKNLSAHAQWLAAMLDHLFRSHANPEAASSEQAAEFISAVGEAFAIALPGTTRSLRTARKKTF